MNLDERLARAARNLTTVNFQVQVEIIRLEKTTRSLRSEFKQGWAIVADATQIRDIGKNLDALASARVRLMDEVAKLEQQQLEGRKRP